MLKLLALSVVIFTSSCFASNIANIQSGQATEGLKQVTAEGNYSNVYSSKEDAKLKAPDAAIDKACGQGFLATIYDRQFSCKTVINGFQCKQTIMANCEPR